MYHHDNRDYGQAVKEANDHFNKTITKKVASAARVIGTVMDTQPHDRVVGTKGLRFAVQTEQVEKVSEKNEIIKVPKHTIIMGTKRGTTGHFEEPMHKHALNQAAERAGIPETFINRMLQRPYGGALIVENFNTIFGAEDPGRFLVRSVKDEVRGVLSDTYKRLDSRPILEAFAAAAKRFGAVPFEGVGGDLRFALKMVMPEVQMVKGEKGHLEAVAFGMQLSNSDFGCGALSLQSFLLRTWCTNTATREDALRRVHLGKRLAEDITYSDKTYELDTQTMVSAVGDHVNNVLAPAKVEEMLKLVETALSTSVDPKKFFERDGELAKLKLTKGEIEKAREAFNNGGVEELPPGNNLYRMSNALSWIAQQAEDAERRLELERAAGQLLDKKAA